MTRLVLAVVALLALAACGDDRLAMIPEPPTTVARPTTTAQPDLSGVHLKPVPGQTTTTSVPLIGGTATLKGTVVTEGGLVPGATVKLERVTSVGVATGEVPTNPDGTWLAPGIQGGRYRIRAWRVPDFAQVEPTLLYLGASEEKTVALEVNRYSGLHVVPSIAPNPPVEGEPANLVVLATMRQVGPTGVVEARPLPSVRAELFGAGTWRVDSPNPTVTDGGGRARWQVRCGQLGQQPLSVLIGDQETAPLSLPACAVGTIDTTLAPAPGSTSTTARTGGATTSTTRR